MVLSDVCYSRLVQPVPMERFVLREEAHSMRDVWRFVATNSGAQFVITAGLMLMQLSFADTWDILDLVQIKYLPQELN